jgi:hypothetical protein
MLFAVFGLLPGNTYKDITYYKERNRRKTEVEDGGGIGSVFIAVLYAVLTRVEANFNNKKQQQQHKKPGLHYSSPFSVFLRLSIYQCCGSMTFWGGSGSGSGSGSADPYL